MKKLTAFLLLICLLAAAIGCTTNPPATGDATPSASSSAAPTAGSTTAASVAPPVGDEPKVLTIMIQEQPTLEDVDTNYATTWMEEQMNCDIQFHVLPNQQWTDKFEVMVAANEKLPDILFGSTNATFVGKHAAAGTFIDITQLYEEHSVHMKAALDADPYAKSMHIFPDGKMYGVGRVQYQTHTEYWNKFFINQTWLDTLGLAEPQTWDELVTAWRAFRDDDPNGNGQNDELPLTGHKDEKVFPYLMGSFTFINPVHYFQIENDNLVLAYMTEGWRNGLRALNALWEEGGIIDPLIFTQDLEQLRAVAQRETDIILGSYGSGNTTFAFQSNYVNAQQYTGLGPMEGPDGTQYSVYTPPSVNYNGEITKDCADPIFAFQFLDFTYNLDATMTIRYGEQGVDWEWLPEGSHGRYTDVIGAPGTFNLLDPTIQSGVQNKWWNVWSPLYIPYSIGDGWPDHIPEAVDLPATNCLGKLVGHIPDEIVGRLMYTPEETTQINEILTNLNTYRDEMLSLFIMGEMDIEADWDAYLAEFEAIGVQQYIDVSQTAWERMR